MKLKLIVSVSLIAAGIGVYLSWQTPVTSASATAVGAETAARPTGPQPVQAEAHKAASTSQPAKAEQIVRNAADAHLVIDQQLEAILQSDTAPDLAVELAPVAEAFPQLKSQIDEYVTGVAEQQQAVAAFRQKLAERNTQVAADGSISASADGMLDYDKKELLAQARRVGEQGMALNQAIREAAYGPQTP